MPSEGNNRKPYKPPGFARVDFAARREIIQKAVTQIVRENERQDEQRRASMSFFPIKRYASTRHLYLRNTSLSVPHKIFRPHSIGTTLTILSSWINLPWLVPAFPQHERQQQHIPSPPQPERELQSQDDQSNRLQSLELSTLVLGYVVIFPRRRTHRYRLVQRRPCGLV